MEYTDKVFEESRESFFQKVSLAEFEAEALREAGVEQEGVERPEEKEAIRENGENQEEENEPGADSSRRNEIQQ